MGDRQQRARREAQEALARRGELEALWREIVGDEPPDPTLDYASKPLSTLSDAWPAIRGAVEEALRALRGLWLPSDWSWFEVASRVLSDYPPLLTDASLVYVTRGGNAYHMFQDCDALRAGQEKAKSDGWTT